MKPVQVVMLSVLCLVLAVGLVVSPHRAFSQEEAKPKVLAKDSYKGIPYLSGGVGIGEREELREMHKNYNLKLMFAQQDGDYLADVKVVIANGKGEKLLDVSSPGPWFYTKLPAGKYNVTATAQGSTAQKEIQVGTSGMTEVILYWKK